VLVVPLEVGTVRPVELLLDLGEARNPGSPGLGPDGRPSVADLYPDVVSRDPRGALRADDPLRQAPEELVEPLGVERPPPPVGERRDAVHLVGVKMVVGVVPAVAGALEGPLPARQVAHPVGVEQTAVEQPVRVDRREGRPDGLGVRLEGSDQLLGLVEFRVGTEVRLVQEHDVRELDLLDHEVRERPVGVVGGGAPLGIAAAEGVEEPPAVDDGDQGVDPVAGGGPRVRREQPRDGGRLGDARGLDDQGVELPVLREPDDRRLEVVLELTADTAVRQLRDAPLDVELRALGDQPGVDVHLAHVVDEDRDVAVALARQQVVQQCRLPGPEAPRQDGDGNGVAHGDPYTTE
jgi:hypothetical protein